MRNTYPMEWGNYCKLQLHSCQLTLFKFHQLLKLNFKSYSHKFYPVHIRIYLYQRPSDSLEGQRLRENLPDIGVSVEQ